MRTYNSIGPMAGLGFSGSWYEDNIQVFDVAYREKMRIFASQPSYCHLDPSFLVGFELEIFPMKVHCLVTRSRLVLLDS